MMNESRKVNAYRHILKKCQPIGMNCFIVRQASF